MNNQPTLNVLKAGSAVPGLWDVSIGKLLQTLSAKAGPVYTPAFSPDGRRLASGHKKATVVWGVKSS